RVRLWWRSDAAATAGALRESRGGPRGRGVDGDGCRCRTRPVRTHGRNGHRCPRRPAAGATGHGIGLTVNAARPQLFCFGLGYSATALAEALRGDGWRIAGTTRNPARAATLADRGFAVVPFDRGRPLADPDGLL